MIWLLLIPLALWASYAARRAYGRHRTRQALRAQAQRWADYQRQAEARWASLNRHGRRATMAQVRTRTQRKQYLHAREQLLLKKVGGRSGLYDYGTAS